MNAIMNWNSRSWRPHRGNMKGIGENEGRWSSSCSHHHRSLFNLNNFFICRFSERSRKKVGLCGASEWCQTAAAAAVPLACSLCNDRMVEKWQKSVAKTKRCQGERNRITKAKINSLLLVVLVPISPQLPTDDSLLSSGDRSSSTIVSFFSKLLC